LRINDHRVPEGAILGPLLFFYICKRHAHALQCTPRLFVDDTSILLNHSSLATLQDNLIEEVTKLSDWCNANKLTIYPTKSNVMVISPKSNSLVKDLTETKPPALGDFLIKITHFHA